MFGGFDMDILNAISWGALGVGVLLVGISFIGAIMCAASEQGTSAGKYYRRLFIAGLILVGIFTALRLT